MATTFSTRLLAGVAALALTATACNGSEGLDPTAERELEEFSSTTTDPPTTEAPPDTAAPTTPATTVAPPVTEATTTIAVVPVTEAPTTTDQDSTPDPRDAEVAAALQEFIDSWVRCAAASPNCDPQTLTVASTGGQLKTDTDIVLGRNSNAWSVSNLDSYRIQVRTTDFINDSTARVTACTEDGLVVTGRTGEVVDESFLSSVNQWTLELVDGTWKVATGRRLRQADGVENTLCDF